MGIRAEHEAIIDHHHHPYEGATFMSLLIKTVDSDVA